MHSLMHSLIGTDSVADGKDNSECVVRGAMRGHAKRMCLSPTHPIYSPLISVLSVTLSPYIVEEGDI